MKLYEFTGKTKTLECGTIVKRIRYTDENILGGFIENESNLDAKDGARVYDMACVYGNAKVHGKAKVYGIANVFGDALVFGNARVFCNALVHGNTRVCDNALVYGNARVCDNALVTGDARVFGNAKVHGNAWVSGNANVHRNNKCTSLVQSCVTHKHDIVITDNHISIGCENHTIRHWRKNIVEIGKSHNYSDNEIKAIMHILDGLLLMRKENT